MATTTTTTTTQTRASLTIIPNKKEFTLNDLFVEALDDEFSCNICYDSLVDCEILNDGEIKINTNIRQCREGHTSCSHCWKKQLENRNECMLCRVRVESFEHLSKNIFLKNELLRKKIFCPNILKYYNKDRIELLKDNKSSDNEESIGCKAILLVEELSNHMKECHLKDFGNENDNDNDNGGSNDNSSNGNSNNKNEIECDKCFKRIERILLRSHQIKICPRQLIECKYGCGEMIVREEMKDHLKQVNHSDYLSDVIIQYKQLYNESKKENEITKRQLRDTQLNLDRLRDELSLIRPTLSFKYKNDWVISEYNSKILDSNRNNRHLNSPEFQVGADKFIIQLFPFGNLAMNSGYLSLYLTKTSNLSAETNVQFSFELLNFDSTKNYKRGSNITVCFNSLKIRAGFPQFIPNKISKDSGFLEGNQLKIRVKLEIIAQSTLQS